VSFGGSNYDAFPHDKHTFSTTPSIGGWAAYEYYLTPVIHFNLVYGYTKFSMDNIAPIFIKEDNTVIQQANSSSLHNYVLINAMWNPYPNFSIGIEFNYGIKNIKSDGVLKEDGKIETPFDIDQSRDASRVSFGFMYNF
jgi:hypothetical protein